MFQSLHDHHQAYLRIKLIDAYSYLLGDYSRVITYGKLNSQH